MCTFDLLLGRDEMEKRIVCLFAALMFISSNLLASNAYVVSQPEQLQLVDINESYQYVNKGFKKRFDLLGSIRRLAMGKISKGWGLKELPDKSPLKIGVVANSDGGPLQFVCVLKGESLDKKLLMARMVEKYGNHLRRHEKEANVEKIELAGLEGTVLPLIDREGQFVIMESGDHFLLSCVLPGHYELIERTVKVLQGERQRPHSVDIAYKGRLTEEERKRVSTFFNRTLGTKVKKFRASLARLLGKLKGKDGKELKTTNERINELFLQLVDWSVDFHYEESTSADDFLYRVAYELQLPSAEQAQKMKELLLEKVLFYKTNAKHEATVLTMDTLALDVTGNTVTIKAEVDTKEGLHSLSYAYVSFLLGYSKADLYLMNN